MAENKKYEKGTFGWLRERQKIKSKKSGFDNVGNWLKLENRSIEEKYGKEFAEWARENKDVPKKYLNLGCKTRKEYDDKLARSLGFDNNSNRRKIYKWDKGINEPIESNDDCSSNFGVHKGEKLFKIFLEEVIFEYVEKTGYRDEGIDFKCKNPRQEFIGKYPQFKLERGKEYKLQLKSRCINQVEWIFSVEYNIVADYFILAAWDNRDNLNPLHIWIFNKNDNVRGRPFWMRYGFSIMNRPLYILQFQEYELKDEIYKLKEIVNGLKDIGEF